jgi:regulator of protease activity HflC (stomatin/prohibitin superfamily)
MVESCGKFEKIAKPGLTCLIPCVQNVSGTVSMRLQQMEVSCETKSKDNVFLTLKVSIQYSVIDEPDKIHASHYRLTNPRVQVITHAPYHPSELLLLREIHSAPLPPSPPSPSPPPVPLLADRVVRLRRGALDGPQDRAGRRLHHQGADLQLHLRGAQGVHVLLRLPNPEHPDHGHRPRPGGQAGDERDQQDEAVRPSPSPYSALFRPTPPYSALFRLPFNPARTCPARGLTPPCLPAHLRTLHSLRVAAEDEGEATKIRAVKEAEAEASRTEIQAKADAEAKFLAGQGISRQRQAIMEGLRESVNAFKTEVKGVDAKTVMDLMIVTQYFDMMKDVGAQGKTAAIFMNSGDGISDGVARGFMSGLPAAPGFAQPSKSAPTIELAPCPAIGQISILRSQLRSLV